MFSLLEEIVSTKDSDMGILAYCLLQVYADKLEFRYFIRLHLGTGYGI